MSENEDKKKGILGAIWESMTKTGGCCGPGESCGCSPKADDDKSKNDEKSENAPSPPKTDSCDG